MSTIMSRGCIVLRKQAWLFSEECWDVPAEDVGDDGGGSVGQGKHCTFFFCTSDFILRQKSYYWRVLSREGTYPHSYFRGLVSRR